jgi:hypothetical protein
VNLTEGVSTGDVASCDPGAWLEPGPSNSLKLVNLYRFLASMPAVTEDSSYDGFAQDCAVLQAANSAAGLSHMPDAGAACYSADAATGSAHSSICGGQGVECIDLYMQDGDSPEMGHRRWIFANYLGPVGFGSVGTGYPSLTGSCFYQPAGSSNAHMPFVAWPPPGEVPLQAITTTEADTAGWSIQSDTINLNSATVTVTDGPTNRPVTVTALPANYGSTYAIRVLPTGWTSAGGHSYAVSVGGLTSPISYTVDVVDCTTIDTGQCPVEDAGTSGAEAGVATGTPDAGGTTTRNGDAGTVTDAAPGGSAQDVSDATSSGATGAAHAQQSSGCSCDVPGAGARPRRLSTAWIFAVAAVALRRRRRS